MIRPCLKLVRDIYLVSLASKIAQKYLRDIEYAYDWRVLEIIGIPAEGINACRWYDTRQHVWVTEPVDRTYVCPVLPSAGSHSSKTVYCNYTKICQVPSLYVGVYYLLNRRIIISAFWWMHFK